MSVRTTEKKKEMSCYSSNERYTLGQQTILYYCFLLLRKQPLGVFWTS